MTHLARGLLLAAGFVIGLVLADVIATALVVIIPRLIEPQPTTCEEVCPEIPVWCTLS